MATARFRGAGRSDCGLLRTVNEDAFGVYPDLGLFVVADGVGGHVGGQDASRLAVETLRDVLGTTGGPAAPSDVDAPDDASLTARRLLSAVHQANARVYAAGGSQAGRRMCTTVAAILLDPDTGRLAVSHVGDSRVYRIRPEGIEQLTEDHSVVAKLVREGRMSADEARSSPHRHAIFQAIGTEGEVSPSIREEAVRDGDVFVLCSDGVHDLIEPDAIADVVRASADDLDAACAALIARANDLGGRDNSTVVIAAPDDPLGT